MESELKKRRETAEKRKEQLVHETILNGRESDQKHSQYPPELRAIARAWSGLKHWGLEDRLNEDICLYYEYLDDGPCAVRMLAYNTSVKKAVLALRTSGKDGLASQIEDKWKEVQEFTFQADDNIPVFRLQLINENIVNIDEKGFSKKVRRAVDSARGKASMLGCDLELVVKQQIEEFESKPSQSSFQFHHRVHAQYEDVNGLPPSLWRFPYQPYQTQPPNQAALSTDQGFLERPFPRFLCCTFHNLL